MTLKHPEGKIDIEEMGDGRRRISARCDDPSTYMSASQWDTAYPLPLIEQILDMEVPAYLCEEIRREEDPGCVAKYLEQAIFAYVGTEDFENKAILDFGCGCGASTMFLRRTFPSASITGVEMMPEALGIAKARAAYYGFSDIEFHQSPSGDEIPEGIGQFDYVIMSGVFEHLLPHERQTLLPILWNALRPDGTLFLDQTPNRWFFVETHTTNLPLLNYLPNGLALIAARHLSRRVAGDITWEALLRRGVRGASAREIMYLINRRAGSDAELLRPYRLGFADEIDVWYAQPSGSRSPALKRILRIILKAVRGVSGLSLLPSLTLAVRKKGT